MTVAEKGVMTSRERVLAVARGMPADRVPVMYWLNPHATCRLMAEYRPGQSPVANFLARGLWRRFIEGGEFDAGVWTRALPLLFEEYGNGRYVLELGADISIQSPELVSPSHFIGSVRKRDGRLRVRGPFGGSLALGGIYMDPVEPAVRSIDELKDFRLPAVTERHFQAIRNFRQAYPSTCVLVEVAAFQQAVCDYIIGTTQFMLALYDYPDQIKAFMERMADWVVTIIQHAVRAGADVVFLQDDYGGTGHPLISPKLWKEFTYPHLRRFVKAAHDQGVPFMLHSCGHQLAFLDSYVEAGVDILQSFQPKAGNNFQAAYEEYGDRLTFATGIDTQRGEMMSPGELREDILRCYRIGRGKGRHILSMTHMMQYTMSAENLHTLFEVVQEIQAGEHD
jgi:uroporphyrinogen-III decarboxylase